MGTWRGMDKARPEQRRPYPGSVILAAIALLLPFPANALTKTIVVQKGDLTGATTAWAVTGLTGCTPVPGTTGSVTIAPMHGTVSIQTVSFTTPNCGSAEFSGAEAFYTWTDNVPEPGGGADFFQITFNGPAQVPGTISCLQRLGVSELWL